MVRFINANKKFLSVFPFLISHIPSFKTISEYILQLTKLHQPNQQKQQLFGMPSVVLREILTLGKTLK